MENYNITFQQWIVSLETGIQNSFSFKETELQRTVDWSEYF